MGKINLITWLLSLLLFGCKRNPAHHAYILPYKISEPREVLIIPEILHEISGVTSIDKNTLACVQEENGIIFIYDLLKKKITLEYHILPDGDYEGIALESNDLFILRSDGILYKITDYKDSTRKVTGFNTGIPAKNNEGLCFNNLTGKLLIACKSKTVTSKSNKDLREVYEFNLQKEELVAQPVFAFQLSEIKNFARRQKSAPNTQNRVDNLKLRISDIAIHPFTKELYVLSAKDHTLLILNEKSEILHVELLDPVLFNKPEGITFIKKTGEMIISNEGGDGKPTLIKFRFIK